MAYTTQVVLVCVGTFITTSLIVGLFKYALIIAYISKKNSVQKTALDLVLIDTIMSLMFYSIISFTCCFLGLWVPLPYWVNGLMTTLLLVITTFTLVSMLVTICLKILMILYSQFFFNVSEYKVRHLTLFLKFFLLLICLLLDNFGPISKDPTIFSFLKRGSSYNQRYL